MFSLEQKQIPLINSHTVGLSLEVHKLSFKINSAKEKINGIYIRTRLLHNSVKQCGIRMARFLATVNQL